MNRNDNRITMLQIPLIEEKYGRAAMISVAVHVLALLVLIFGVKLFPKTAIYLGSGPGGGASGIDIATVGVVDQFSGGAGMFKPSMVPQPPALVPTPPAPAEKASVIPPVDETVIPLPERVDPPKPKPQAPKPESKPEPKPESKPEPKPKSKPAEKPAAKTAAKPKESTQPPGNAVPVEARPGSGGTAGSSGGSGGGIGGGSGISVGTGSGGAGDSWYAQAVERRISERWQRPPEGICIDVTYSFNVNPDGGIYNINKEKASGNSLIDGQAERAIRGANPLSKPPREFQGRSVQFVVRFVHPPDCLDD
jgi:protein TonB